MRTHSPSLSDKLISQFDRMLRTLSGQGIPSEQPNPAAEIIDVDLDDRQRRHAAGLMRVNHTGEVCAQALYQGQALTAKLDNTRFAMESAATEEMDHLAWCEQRLKELRSQPSLLNPLWYGLSFGLGAGAGLISDRISLGFVAATEERVCAHLRHHLQSLPEEDTKSRSIVSKMLEDEEQHGKAALDAGGAHFPRPIKMAMSAVAKVMTLSSYRI